MIKPPFALFQHLLVHDGHVSLSGNISCTHRFRQPFVVYHLSCPSAVPSCRNLLPCPSAVPCCISLQQCPSATQMLESEKQDAVCQAEQQQQEYTLQMQCLHQACQDTLQRERAQHDEQVHLYCLYHMHDQERHSRPERHMLRMHLSLSRFALPTNGKKLISSCVHAGKAMLTEESTASSRSTLCKAAKLSQQFLVMSAGVYVNLCSQLCFLGLTLIYADCMCLL